MLPGASPGTAAVVLHEGPRFTAKQIALALVTALVLHAVVILASVLTSGGPKHGETVLKKTEESAELVTGAKAPEPGAAPEKAAPKSAGDKASGTEKETAAEPGPKPPEAARPEDVPKVPVFTGLDDARK